MLTTHRTYSRKQRVLRRLGMLALLPAVALAQGPAADDDAEDVPRQARSQSIVDEMFVTAQRREQSLQDVSVAVSAFSGEALDRMGYEEGLDITQQVPNMNYFAIFGEASSPSITLRGIGLVNFSDSWEPPVGMYVDDVYRGNPAGTAIQLFDIDRVEVLRGPQGTLYGRNTTGGLTHYVTRKPGYEADAYAQMRVGSFDERVFEGAIGGPLFDGVRGRLAFKRNRNGGWQTNTVDGRSLNTTNTIALRGHLDIDLTPQSTLLLTAHGSQADQRSVGFAHMGYLDPNDLSTTCAVSAIHRGQCSSNTFELTGDEAVNGRFGPRHVASSASDGLATEIDTFGVSATVNWTFENFELTSITAYETLDKFLQDDGDGTEVIWFDEQYSVDAEQISQELRLTGSTTYLTWVTGAYLFTDSRELATEAPTTADGLWHQELVDLDTDSWALFGQVEYQFAPTLTAIVGARYTDEKKDFRQDSGPSFFDPVVTGIRNSLSESAVTGRLGLDWRPAERTLAYASLATGFKSGGFSGSYNSTVEATEPVSAEEAISFELGLKTTVLDGRVQLNSALFWYEVQDFQAQIFDTVATGGVIANAGDVTGIGAEIEATARVTDNFELLGGIGWLDTEFDSDQEFNVAQEFFELDGNELPAAPGLTYNLVARYYMNLGEFGELTLQGDYAWRDSHYLQIENDPFSRHGSYGIGNARIAWHSADGRYDVAAFVENLTDEEYFTYQNTLGDDWGYAVWGKPRWVGMSFGVTL